ncbi:MAG: hypothetical protein ChlgKO_11000 [Chlamydiales bacterium]
MLETRYPQLSFLLRLTEKKVEPRIQPLPPLKIEDKEILYILGIGHYDKLKSWLHEKAERKLIYLEDDLQALHHINTDFLNDPQVHLRVRLQDAPLEIFADELAEQFPFDQLEVLDLKNTPNFSELKLLIQRKTTVRHAIFQERFYYPKLCANLLENFPLINGAGYINHWENTLSGIPAIICGAGPSIETIFPLLREMQDRALIIAGGTAISVLTKAGIQPHLGIAIDPNPEEYHHLKDHKAGEMPLIFASRLQPKALRLFTGPKIYYRSFTGGPLENWLEEEIGLTDPPLQKTAHQEALSVTTAALNIAAHLGCKEISLAGIDLAYTDGKRYPDQKKSPTKSKRVRDETLVQGGIETQVKWVMEADWIAAFAKTHRDIALSTCTTGGLKLAIPYKPLAYTKKIKLPLENFTKLQVDIQKPLQTLFASLKRCKTYIDEMDGPLYEVAFDDLQNELAYTICLKTFLKAVEKRFSTKEKKIHYLKLAIQEFDKYEKFLLNM